LDLARSQPKEQTREATTQDQLEETASFATAVNIRRETAPSKFPRITETETTTTEEEAILTTVTILMVVTKIEDQEEEITEVTTEATTTNKEEIRNATIAVSLITLLEIVPILEKRTPRDLEETSKTEKEETLEILETIEIKEMIEEIEEEIETEKREAIEHLEESATIVEKQVINPEIAMLPNQRQANVSHAVRQTISKENVLRETSEVDLLVLREMRDAFCK